MTGKFRSLPEEQGGSVLGGIVCFLKRGGQSARMKGDFGLGRGWGSSVTLGWVFGNSYWGAERGIKRLRVSKKLFFYRDWYAVSGSVSFRRRFVSTFAGELSRVISSFSLLLVGQKLVSFSLVQKRSRSFSYFTRSLLNQICAVLFDDFAIF